MLGYYRLCVEKGGGDDGIVNAHGVIITDG